MKKLFLVVSLLGAMVASADDSYLYWMVDTTMANDDYAKIRVNDGTQNNYLNIYTEGLSPVSGGDSVTGAEVADAAAWGEGFYAGLDGISLAQGFVVELYNSGDAFLGESVISPAAASAAVYKGGMAVPAAAETLSSFSIPEPNSALLMLVGCAMLGLRRRKLKAA